MVRHYYGDDFTDISKRALLPLCRTLVPPTCLLGGWAVHFQVNEGFQQAHGREYIGSRDVDFGFHVDPDWTAEELRKSPIGRSVRRVTEAGYDPLSFRFVRYFDQETGESISEAESQALPPHRVFNLYLDVIADTPDLGSFRDVLGFTPPADPLLNAVFSDGAGESLAEFREWDIPESVRIADPVLLASMKIRSIPDRDRAQKRVKDVADLHSLLWYTRDYNEMRSDVRSRLSENDIEQLGGHVDTDIYAQAATLLQIETDLVQDTIDQLIS